VEPASYPVGDAGRTGAGAAGQRMPLSGLGPVGHRPPLLGSAGCGRLVRAQVVAGRSQPATRRPTAPRCVVAVAVRHPADSLFTLRGGRTAPTPACSTSAPTPGCSSGHRSLGTPFIRDPRSGRRARAAHLTMGPAQSAGEGQSRSHRPVEALGRSGRIALVPPVAGPGGLRPHWKTPASSTARIRPQQGEIARARPARRGFGPCGRP
jgi:hypothetical protein